MSLKLNQKNNTLMVITERLSECRKVRVTVCVPICLSVSMCICVPVCFYVGTWIVFSVCIWGVLSVSLDKCVFFVWCAVLCSMYDYLRGTASFLSFIFGQQSKTACQCLRRLCVQFMRVCTGPWRKTSLTLRWPKRTVIMVTTNPFYSSVLKQNDQN